MQLFSCIFLLWKMPQIFDFENIFLSINQISYCLIMVFGSIYFVLPLSNVASWYSLIVQDTKLNKWQIYWKDLSSRQLSQKSLKNGAIHLNLSTVSQEISSILSVLYNKFHRSGPFIAYSRCTLFLKTEVETRVKQLRSIHPACFCNSSNPSTKYIYRSQLVYLISM